MERWNGFTDPEVLAFIAANAGEVPARVELLADAADRVWAYELDRNGWVCGDLFIAEEERSFLEVAFGPLTEIAV